MRKFIFFTFLTVVSLFACSGEFMSCSQKAYDAKVFKASSLIIPLNNNQNLLFTQNRPTRNLIAYNPFLGLALASTKNGFAYPYDFSDKKDSKLAVVTPLSIKKINVMSKQEGLDKLAHIKKSNDIFALIQDGCCNLEGIMTPRGIISKEFLRDFIEHKNSFYADAGMRMNSSTASIIVTTVDPFFKKNVWQRGDIIVRFNKKKYSSSAALKQAILFSRAGTTVTFDILRDKQAMTLHMVLDKRYGGGLISDTFLERKGFYFTSNLSIKSLNDLASTLQLKRGDKLIRVNNKLVTNQTDVKKQLHKDKNNLLFERNGFQFNIKLL